MFTDANFFWQAARQCYATVLCDSAVLRQSLCLSATRSRFRSVEKLFFMLRVLRRVEI